ncbi:beta-hexosaminidase [Labilibacter sediminis]|nr:beta-hexosaminidase [Labilibacter sediminis]
MKLKFVGLFVVTLTLLACSKTVAKKVYNEGARLTPKPLLMVEGQGSFMLNKNTSFVNSNDQLKDVISLFVAKVKSSTGFKLAQQSKALENNFIQVSVDENKFDNQEAYTLDVTTQGVKVVGASKEGVFYGLQSLMQLLPAEIESKSLITEVEWSIPVVQIKDEPRFKYRGMHLDVCRHFVPVEDIKKHLDLMAMYKLNKFHWHLTEDQGWRIEIKKYPLLTEIGSKRKEADGYEYGGFYTQEEVKGIVAYAKARMIDVIPEIELPGHSLAALTAYPEFSCTGGPFKVRNIWGIEPDVYCAGKEETFKFLEDVIAEVVPLFPSEYFHIGGDECPKVRWEVCKDCQARIKQEGLKDEHELQSYVIKRIEKVLLGHGKKMIGWDEILEGGLAESATVMSWRGEKGGIEAASHGHDVIMTPGNWCYLDHYQGSNEVEPVAIGGYTTLEESYSYDPVPKKITAEHQKHILGTQGNVWTEYMYTPKIVEYFTYPRIIALAEVNWTQPKQKDFKDFLNRLDNQQVRLDMYDVNYHIPLPEGPCNYIAFTDSVQLSFSTTRPVKMVYTLDGSLPTAESTVYNDPISISENTELNIASVLVSGKMSPVRTIQVEKQDYLPSVEESTQQGVLKLKVTDGNFLSAGELESVTAWKEDLLNMKKKTARKHNVKYTKQAKVLTGFIEIPDNGVYEFSTLMDQLFIGDHLVVDNEGEVKKFARNNSTIALAKGKHPIKIVHLENTIGGWPSAWNNIEVRYREFGTRKFKKVSPKMYSH